MGWWKVQNTNNLIGDQALDVLGGAVLGVVREYQQGLGRKPTVGEWEALLLSVLGAEEPAEIAMADGSAKSIRITVE